MDVESSICLSDLVPALRWSRPQQVAEALTDPRLPAGWWSSLELSRALSAVGMDPLCERLARLAVARWDHLPLADVLPALQVHHVDPALTGWPEPARSMITGLGGWNRLKRLSAGDLAGSSEQVIASLFREVLNRAPARAAASPLSAPMSATGSASRSSATSAAGSSAMSAAASSPAHTPASAHTPTSVHTPASAHTPASGPAAHVPTAARSGNVGPAGAAGQTPTAPAAPAPAAGHPSAVGHPSAASHATSAGHSSSAGQAPAAADEPVALSPEHIMTRVVDGLFKSFDRLELAVAVHRLFAEDPVSLRELAHRMLVDRDALSIAQRTAEERVLMWLRSSESAPVTGHMFRLTEWLGAAATEEQLIGADPEHPVIVPSLHTPLWRVLVTLMPDRRLQDGWLVVGDLRGLQRRTHQLLASAPRDVDYAELLGELGIRLHSAKAWLEALPPESVDAAFAGSASPEAPALLPRRTPGANGHHHRGGQPIPQAPAIDPSAALAALSALSGGRTGASPNGSPANGAPLNGTPLNGNGLPERVPGGHGLPERNPGGSGYGPANGSNGYGAPASSGGLGGFGGMSGALAGMPGMPGSPSSPPPSPTSDPRRWQRIDVTPEHLRGGPVTVPEGYATQLGMRPGTLLSVTGPGNNAVVLVWPGDRQPVFDSLQPVLMKLNARPGDQVYVTVDGYRLEAQLTG